MSSKSRRRQIAVASAALLAGGAALSGVLASQAEAAAPAVHGYAAVSGSTTGGAGGSTVTVTSLAALQTEAKSSGKKIIKVSGLFTCSADVTVASDKSIVGGGSGSGLVGCGLKLKGVKNVIIQNLNISKVRSGTGDAIHLEKSDHVWIDHNTLSSDQSHGKDYYDGLVDLSHAVDYVTVSWNYLHDHYKASLVGHSDSNKTEDTGKLHVTYDHNYFKNINSRTPSLRFGTGHVYDNYFENGSTGVHSRMGAQMLVQNNVFRGVATPVLTTGDSKADGYVVIGGNDFGTGKNKITKAGSLTKVPYAVTLDPASSVVSAVKAGAGAGRL
jgi:pectate lyase